MMRFMIRLRLGIEIFDGPTLTNALKRDLRRFDLSMKWVK